MIQLEGFKRTFILNFFIVISLFACQKQKKVMDSNYKKQSSASLLNEAEAFYKEGNYEKVINITNQLDTNRRGVKEDSLRANVLLLRSIAGRHQGSYSISIEACKSALKIRQRLYGEKHAYLISVYNNLGNIYSNMHSSSDENNSEPAMQAIKYYEKALACEGIGNRKPSIYNHIGSNYRHLKNYQQAIKYFDMSLADSSQASQPQVFKCYVYASIGECYLDQKNHQQAIKYLNISLSNSQKHLQSHYLVAQNLCNLGAAYQGSKDYHTALSYYEKAEKVNHQKHLIKLEILYGKAKTLSLQKQIKKSLEVARKADQMISKVRDQLTPKDAIFFSKKAHELNLLAFDICLKLKDYESLFYFSERNKANVLGDALQAKTKTIPEIQKNLTADQALIEYTFLDSASQKLAIFYMDKQHFKVSFVKSKNIKTDVLTYLEAIGEVKEAKTTDLSKKLHKLLIHPLDIKAKALIIVPDGILFQVPFDALSPDGSENRYLIQKYLIAHAPSAAIAFRSHKKKNYKYEYIGFAPRFKYLEHSIKEIEHSAEFFPFFYRKTYVNTQATIDNFRSIPSTRVLHISTHSATLPSQGYYRRPQKGLVFHNESILSDSINHVDADLVMLSACGDLQEMDYVAGEGYQSLMHAFLPRANYVIYPIFYIPDAGGYNLSGLFFTNLEKGMSYHQALHLAKLEAISLPNSSPYFWAGLVITY